MRRLVTPVILLATLASPVFGITQKVEPTPFERLVLADPALHSGRHVASLDEVASRVPNASGWLDYRQSLGKDAVVMLDLRTGEPALVRGKPEPWIPGSGNTLTMGDLEQVVGRRVSGIDATVLRDLGRRFLERHAGLFRVDTGELEFREAVPVGRNLWVVTFEQRVDGIPVEGSRLTMIVGHGNLILWGSEHIAPVPRERTVPAIESGAAESMVQSYVGWIPDRDRWDGEPELVLVPEALPVNLSEGPLGSGAGHRLVWQLAFHRKGVTGTWMARVDAVTGDLLEFGDVNAYGGVRGGVEPETWTDPEHLWPLPLVHLSSGGYTSLEGLFADPGTAVSGDLHGQLTTIQDQCGTAGTPTVASDASGDIDFSTGPANPDGDADCTTNGVGENGGEHNTHAARSAYYHITWIKEKGSQWLPTNAWLSSAHEVRVNVNDVCNAYWQPNGGYNAFFQEGFYNTLHCFNTGEIAGVFLHEVGHGLDQNDAQGTADGGTGEAYADTHAMLQLHDSCIGPGFWNQQCTGYGLPCVDCTGVRDTDYANHVDGNGNPVTVPFTPANFTGPHCSTGFSSGPCGREVHCESYPGTGAIWDLAVRKLPGVTDQATAWYITERDWYLGMQIATSMFNCNSSTFASDGCAATSWFQAMLAADDDDGDLTNGTPHAAQLFEAFNDHAIACGAAGDAANQSASACPALVAPDLTVTAGASSIQLDWTAVSGATEYVILKNHGECDQGYVQTAVVAAPATSWEDTDVARYMAYSYRVVARTDNDSCFSAMSNCGRASLVDCPGSITDAPTLTIPADNQVQVAWDDSGSCSGFNVYRRQGGCADSGFEPIVAAAASSPVVDSAVSGGVTYGYRITALDSSGQLESGFSPCAEITATGVCNETPAFGGVVSAVNSHTGACGIDVSWNAGSTVCPGQSVVYNVYRDTSSGFVPSAANRVASGVAGTSWHDDGVTYGSTYYYVVRAEALSGAGSGPNGGVEDDNTVEASAAPSGPDTDLFSDDMEGGTSSWTAVAGPNDGGNGTSPWGQVTDSSHSPSKSWFVSDESQVKDQVLAMTNTVTVPAGAPAVLEFWHDFDTESGYDGGVLEYSSDGGGSWHDILESDGGSIPANSDRILSGGYTRTLATGYSNPLPGRQAWTGDSSGWQQVSVDLSEMTGQALLFRWRLGCDSSASRTGWWLDDVRIFYGSQCSSCPGPTFSGIASATDHGTAQAAVDLSWSPATDTCGTGSIRYRVYHGPNSGSVDFTTPVAWTDGTSLTVMGILVEQHCFGVRAVDGQGGEDGNTAVLCVTPAAQVGSGDADCDSQIETPDLERIVAVIFGATDCGSGYQAADVDASGSVDATDLGSEVTYLHDGL